MQDYYSIITNYRSSWRTCHFLFLLSSRKVAPISVYKRRAVIQQNITSQCVYTSGTFARGARVHIYEILGCTQEMRSESIRAQSDMGIRVPRGYSDIHNGPDSRRTLDMCCSRR